MTAERGYPLDVPQLQSSGTTATGGGEGATIRTERHRRDALVVVDADDANQSVRVSGISQPQPPTTQCHVEVRDRCV